MKITCSTLLLASLLVCFTLRLQAQAVSGEDLKTQMVKDWERAKDYTLEYLHTMPADKYSFKPVDSIRSFAQQMLHLAQGSVFLATNGTGQTRIFGNTPLDTRASAQAADSVLYFVTASYDYVIQGLKGMDPAKFGEMVGPGNRKEARYVWIMKAFEHQTHHRGQATIYIRLQGIRPPQEKLF